MQIISYKKVITILTLAVLAGITNASAESSPTKITSGADSGSFDPLIDPPVDYDGKTSITEALSSAYITNSDLQAKLHEQFARHEAINQAISGFRPSVSASGQYGRVRSSVNLPVRGRTVLSPHSGSIEVQQNLFNSLGTWYGWDSAQKGVKAGLYDFINTEQTTLFNAAQAYLNVIFRKASVEFNQANVKFLSEQLRAVRASVEVGEKTVTDIAQAESRLAQGNAQLSAAEAELQNNIANYVQVIGKQPDMLTYPESLTNLPASREELIESALKYNPAVLNAEYNYEKARSDVKVSGSELLPRVDLTGSASRSFEQSRKGDRTDTLQGTLRLTIPIYQQGAKWSALRQKGETESQARYQLEQARKATIENAIKAWENLNSARKQTASFKKQVEFAKISLDGVILQVDVGERPYIDILDAQKELLQAQTGLEEARKNERVAEYQIYSVQGRLTATGIQLPVETYDVQGHLENVKYKFFGFGPNTDNATE